jgi:hypothetical protein
LKPQSADRIGRILASHKVAEQGFKSFAIGVVLAGVELAALKREAGPGHWPDVLVMFLEPAGITDRHVDRYIAVATSAARNHKVDVDSLLNAPNSVDAEVWARLSEHITSSTNATTWRALIDGMGMAKRETRGGYRADPELAIQYAAKNCLTSTRYEDWAADVQATFRAWVKRQFGGDEAGKGKGDLDARAQARAIRNWSPVIGQLQVGIDGSDTWSALPKPMRVQFRALCLSMAECIGTTLG